MQTWVYGCTWITHGFVHCSTGIYMKGHITLNRDLHGTQLITIHSSMLVLYSPGWWTETRKDIVGRHRAPHAGSTSRNSKDGSHAKKKPLEQPLQH